MVEQQQFIIENKLMEQFQALHLHHFKYVDFFSRQKF